MTTEANDFELRNGVLFVNRQALYDHDLCFDEACRELLEEPEQDLLIDLSHSTYIDSTYVGLLAAAFFQAHACKKKLRVRASPEVAKVLRAVGFEEFVPVEEVG